MHLLLTQIDQREPDEVAKVERTVRDQLSRSFDLKELPITSVSADRYQRGIRTENAKLREMSGMVPIFATVKRIKSEVTSLRKRETRRLAGKLLADLNDKLSAIDSELTEINNKRREMKRRLLAGSFWVYVLAGTMLTDQKDLIKQIVQIESLLSAGSSDTATKLREYDYDRRNLSARKREILVLQEQVRRVMLECVNDS